MAYYDKKKEKEQLERQARARARYTDTVKKTQTNTQKAPYSSVADAYLNPNKKGAKTAPYNHQEIVNGRRNTTTQKNTTTQTGRKTLSGIDYSKSANTTRSMPEIQKNNRTRMENDAKKYAEKREQQRKEREEADKRGKMGEAGAQNPFRSTSVDKKENERRSSEWQKYKSLRTQKEIEDDKNKTDRQLANAGQAYAANVSARYDYENTEAGKKAQAELNKLSERIGKLDKEQSREAYEISQKDEDLNRDWYTYNVTAMRNKAEKKVVDANDDMEKWGEKAGNHLAAVMSNSSVADKSKAELEGKKINPYRKNDSGMSDEMLYFTDLLYGYGLTDETKELEGYMKSYEEYDRLTNLLNDRAFETDYIVAGNYEAKARQMLEEAKNMPWGDARTDIENKAKAYNDMAQAYRNSGDQMTKQYKYQIEYNDLGEKDSAARDLLVRLGEENDTLISNLSDEDKSWAINASSWGSANRDDSYRAASLTMTDEERGTYLMLKGREAEGSVAKGTAEDYIKTLYDTGGLKERYAEKLSEGIGSLEESGQIDSTLLGIYETFQATASGAVKFGDAVFNGIKLSIAESGGAKMDVPSERLAESFLQKEKERTGNIGIDVGETIGFMLPTVAVSVATGGAGSPAVVGMLAASGTTFAGTYGDTYMRTRREGYEPEEASVYATINASLEAGLQAALTGVASVAGGAVTKNFASNMGKRATAALLRFSESPVGRSAFSRAAHKIAGNALSRKFLSQAVVNACSGLGEFAEESLQEILDPLVRNMVLGEDNDLNPFNEDVMYAGGMGFLVSMLMNVPTSARALSNTSRRGMRSIQSGDVEALINRGLEKPQMSDAFRQAQLIKDGGIEKANPIDVGLLQEALDVESQTEADVKRYIDGNAELKDISAIDRHNLFDPRNANANAKLYGVDINENMSPQEIRKAFEDAHYDKIIAEENLRNKQVNLRAASEAVADKGMQKFLNRLQRLGNKEVLVADGIRDMNGNAVDTPAMVTRSALVLDSSLFSTEEGMREGVRYAVSHELSHLIQNSKMFNAIALMAQEYFELSGVDWEGMIADMQQEYETNKKQKLTEWEAVHELVGDYFRDTLFSEGKEGVGFEGLKKFVYENTSLAKRLSNLLKSFVLGDESLGAGVVTDAYHALEKAFEEVQSPNYDPNVTLESGDNMRLNNEEYPWSWATKSGLLTGAESRSFFDGVGEIKKGNYVPQTEDGLYKISVGENKVALTNGDYVNPSVDSIIELKIDNKEDLADIRNDLIYDETRTIDEFREDVEAYFGAGSFQTYTSKDTQAVREVSERQGRQRSSGETVSRNAERLQERGGSNSQARYASDTTLQERMERNKARKLSDLMEENPEGFKEVFGDVPSPEAINYVREIENGRKRGVYTEARRALRDLRKNYEKTGKVDDFDVARVSATLDAINEIENLNDKVSFAEEIIKAEKAAFKGKESEWAAKEKELRKDISDLVRYSLGEEQRTEIEKKLASKEAVNSFREKMKARQERTDYIAWWNKALKDKKTAEKKARKQLRKTLENAQKKAKNGSAYERALRPIFDKMWIGTESITEGSKVKGEMVAQAIEYYKEAMGEDAPVYKDLLETVDKARKKKISEMSIDEVEAMQDFVDGVNFMVKTQNQIYMDEQYTQTADFAKQAFNDINGAVKFKANKGTLSKVFNLSSATPRTVFRAIEGHTGKSFSKIYDELQNGQTQSIKKTFELSRPILEFFSGKEGNQLYKEWTGKKQKQHGTGIFATNKMTGQVEEITLTSQQRMAIYMNSKDISCLQDMLGVQKVDGNTITFEPTEMSGISVPDYKLLMKGKVEEAYVHGARYSLSQEQLNGIIESMPVEEKAFCDVLDGMYASAAEAINEVSLQEVGFERARVENYYQKINDPKVVKNGIKVDSINSGGASSASILKHRSGSAGSAPILLANVLDVANSYIDMASHYYGFALPEQTLKRVMNSSVDGVSLRHKLEMDFGTETPKYIDKLMSDLKTSKETTWADKMRSNYAQAILNMNFGVVLKQAASYPTAGAVVGYEALAKGFFRNVDVEIVRKYSPYFAYRELSGGNVETGDIRKYKAGAKFSQAVDFINKMDLATVKKLWGAAEVWVENNHPELKKGSEEYYQAVGKMHERIITETQPNYTILQRPQLLRSNNPLVRAVFMFRTQLMQNYNLLYDSAAELRSLRARGETSTEQYKEAQAKAARTITSQIIASSVIAAITMMNNWFLGRDDWKDEEGNVDTKKLLSDLGLGAAESFSGSFVGGSEAFNVAKQIYSNVTGEELGTYGLDITAPQLDMINNLVQGGVDLMSLADPELSPNEKFQIVRKFGHSVAKLVGVPSENVEKYSVATLKKVGELLGDRSFEAWYDNLRYGTSTKKIKEEKNDDRAKAMAKELVSDVLPKIKNTDVEEEFMKAFVGNRADEIMNVNDMLPTKKTSLTIGGQDVALTETEKTRYNNIVNKEYNELAQAFINSEDYTTLTERQIIKGFAEIADHAQLVAKNKIAAEHNLKVDEDVYDKLSSSEVRGTYVAYRARTTGAGAETEKILPYMFANDEVKRQIYNAISTDKEAEKINAAIDNGTSTFEYLRTKEVLGVINNSKIEDKTTAKKEWLLKNMSSEESLASLYASFFETSETKEENTIKYAMSQGVRAEAFINREIQKVDETTDYDGVSEDYVYKVVDGEPQIVVDEKGKAISGSKMKKALAHMLNGGYTEEEMTYFYQKEYGSDDTFVWAKMSGMSTQDYLEFRESTASLKADKDANGKSISGSLKKKIFDAIDSLQTSRINKLMMYMKSYTLTKKQYQEVIDHVNSLSLSKDNKLQILAGLGVQVDNGIAYPRKAK